MKVLCRKRVLEMGLELDCLPVVMREEMKRGPEPRRLSKRGERMIWRLTDDDDYDYDDDYDEDYDEDHDEDYDEDYDEEDDEDYDKDYDEDYDKDNNDDYYLVGV